MNYADQHRVDRMMAELMTVILRGEPPADLEEPVRDEELRILCKPYDRVGWGFHKHRCPNCGTTWKHADDVPERATTEQFETAHTCPHCGQHDVTMKYWPN